jgi:hypothetical protein
MFWVLQNLCGRGSYEFWVYCFGLSKPSAKIIYVFINRLP